MSYAEIDTELLLLAANGRERAAKVRLREMTPDEWRVLREAIARLDAWLDDVILERHAAQPRKES